MPEDKEIKPADAAKVLGLVKIEEQPQKPAPKPVLAPEPLPTETEAEELDELIPEWADKEIKVKIWKFYQNAGRVVHGAQKRLAIEVAQARKEAGEMVEEVKKAANQKKEEMIERVEKVKDDLDEGIPKAKKEFKKTTKETKSKIGGTVAAVASLAVCCGLSGLAYLGFKYAGEKKELEESRVDVEAEQKAQEIADQQRAAYDANYLRYAKNGLKDKDGNIYQGIIVPGLKDDQHILNSDVQIQAALRGPSWIFAMYPESGSLHVNDLLVERIAGELGVSPAELKTEWPRLNSDPAYAAQYLQAHGASPAVVNFYQCTLDVFNKDQDKATWQDRVPGVQACAVKAKSSEIHSKAGLAAPTEHKKEHQESREEFYSVANKAIITAGGNPEDLGILETASLMPLDLENTIEMIGLDVAEITVPTVTRLENSPLGLVMAGLVLIRIGLSLPREIIAGISRSAENIYFWFKLGQAPRMMRDLISLGQKFIKAVSKSGSSGAENQ